jgi:excinuclease UvrABC ATPase subunit
MADALFSKVTCRRCGGSGKFSFHLTKGTVCFGCNGTGTQLVDLKKEAAAKARAAKRQAAQAARAETMRAAYNAVVAEMNALLGPFDVDTPLGLDRLNQACGRKFGKALHVVRDERIKAAA